MKSKEIITKEHIKAALDQKCVEDLKAILQTPEGRRFFSWIILDSGFKSAGIRGNSQDFYISGRRSIGADIMLACDAMGLEGLDLRYKAEKEYLLLQMAIEEELKEKE